MVETDFAHLTSVLRIQEAQRGIHDKFISSPFHLLVLEQYLMVLFNTNTLKTSSTKSKILFSIDI